MFGAHPGFRRCVLQLKPLGPVCFVDYDDEKCATTVMGLLQGMILTEGEGRGLRIEYARSQMSPNSKIPKISELSRPSSNISSILPGQRELPMISIGLPAQYGPNQSVGPSFQPYFSGQPTFPQTTTNPGGFQGSYWGPNPYSNQYGGQQGNPMMIKPTNPGHPSSTSHNFHEY